jgi:hypothetical protein
MEPKRTAFHEAEAAVADISCLPGNFRADNDVPAAEACKAIADEFRAFGRKLKEAGAKGLGLVWISA